MLEPLPNDKNLALNKIKAFADQKFNFDFAKMIISVFDKVKNIVGKEKMLVTSIFSFSRNVFYPFQKEFLFLSYTYFVVCKCFQFGQV